MVQILNPPKCKKFFDNHNFPRRLMGELHPFEKFKSCFNLSDSIETEVLELLEKRECGLSAESLGENHHHIPCCPTI